MAFNKKNLTQFIKDKARELGFDEVGIARARRLSEAEPALKAWLEEGMHGEMHYMENHYEKRLDPGLLVDGSKSLVTVLLNYFPGEKLDPGDRYRLSKYAYGADYHVVVKQKLTKLLEEIEKVTGPFRARVFTDSAPLMDKVWAREAGLGWIGKNTCLINKKRGSYCFIGHLVCDLELEYEQPYTKDHCGSCNLCLEACPTGAIHKPYQLDARKCISYLTIEYRGPFSKEQDKSLHGWIFGCDICQDVCPWNGKAVAHKTTEFNPTGELKQMQAEDWINLTEEKYKILFRHSAVSRVKYTGLKRNILSVANQCG
jgi:epoxyqueuosine reductase